MCYMSDEVFKAIGKRLKSIDHIDQTDTNNISISFVHEEINLISQWIAIIGIMRAD